MSHLRRGGIWKIGRKGWKCTFGFENFLVPGVWIGAGAAAGVGAGEPAGKVVPRVPLKSRVLMGKDPNDTPAGD